MTTHHLEEAEARCARTVIIDHGKVIAAGTLRELVEQTVGRFRLVTLRLDSDAGRAAADITRGASTIEIDGSDPRLLRARMRDVALRTAAAARSRAAQAGALGRRRRGARTEPAVGLHPSDRKGARE